MCLSLHDVPTKKHTVGYKIFIFTDDEKILNSPIIRYKFGYMMGKSYHCRNITRRLPPVVSTSKSDHKYLAGFHYYLRLQDAKNVCKNRKNSCVVRILVTSIIETGKCMGIPVGVSRRITLDRYMLKPKSAYRIKTIAVNKMIKLPLIKKLISLAQRTSIDNAPKNISDEFSNLLLSIDNLRDMACFVDLLGRDTQMFKRFTRLWRTTLKSKDSTILEHYYKIVDENQNKDSDFRNKFKSEHIDSLNLDYLL